jgi:2-amino-4-hydroxy-6-hydroxymethyldihydropteridine diphosphokinase
MNFRTVYISLGSNLGNREARLKEGIRELEDFMVEQKAIKSITLSPIYETEAWGMKEGTPAFLNQVLALETDLTLSILLKALLEIETICGRKREVSSEENAYSSRTLDLDILLDGNTILKTKKLEVPHPRITERRFVLQPLADLDPKMLIPGKGCTVGEALENSPKKPKVRLK